MRPGLVWRKVLQPYWAGQPGGRVFAETQTCRTFSEKLRPWRSAKGAKSQPCEELPLPSHHSAVARGETGLKRLLRRHFVDGGRTPCIASSSGPRPCLARLLVFRIDPWDMWVRHCAERYGNAIKHRRAFHSSSQWGGAWGRWLQGSQKNSWGVVAGPETLREIGTAPGLSLHQALPPAALQPWASQNGEHGEALGGGLHLGEASLPPSSSP